MFVCKGGICIFCPLNENEMSRRALGFLLCDRNHIIDWYTESCPSKSPRRAKAASDENKDRFEAVGSMCKLSIFASLIHSLCAFASLNHPLR